MADFDRGGVDEGGGGGCDGTGVIESTGEGGGKWKNGEEDAGRLFMGKGGADVAGKAPDFTGDV
uniref:Uncharacterized protein n=1 Tax=Oryza sativa subsp. japonica TaxID=39947 RepID=Q69LL5_ORYSJ|nr:hypothetical protein [Oryza sativa Japonica Group]BAD31760.1 hypothetical protein [Oryza sativa Japonica Group]